jgi:hypothetical protein
MSGPEQSSRQDWLLLGLLVALVLPLRCWLLFNTEVTARDGIGYIRYALTFERKAWHEVWKEQDQHPGYPVAVWAMSVPLREWTGRTDAEVMRLSAQLVSMLAALLLLYPMYHAGRLLFGRAVAFWGSLLFQCWPVSGQHLSDGISETLFLLLVVSALLQAVRAVEGQSVPRFVLCGLFCGLAYLTRPEGALLIPVVLLVLLARQFSPLWRCSRKRLVASGASLVLAACAAGGVYVYATGRITNKLSALEVIGKVRGFFVDIFEPLPDVEPPLHAALGRGAIFAAHFPPTQHLSERLGKGSAALVAELNHGFHYIGGWLALLGLWCSFHAVWRRPGFWVLMLYGVLHAVVLLALAMVVFYVSDRHTMVLLLVGSYLAAAGVLGLATRLKGGPAGLGGAVLMIALVAFCLPKTTQRLHANRACNRQAGEWLASRLAPGDVIVDDHYWTHYYSGLLFLEGRETAPRPGTTPWCYDVHTRTRGQPLERARGEVVWPAAAEQQGARVVLYKRPRERDKHPWD